jgi:uncharacterized protein
MGLIYLDSCVVTYLVENHPLWAEEIQNRMAQQELDVFAISPLVKLECLVKPLQTGDLVLQKRYESVFEQLSLLPLGDDVFLQAAQLRSRFGLKTPDALHLACAQTNECRSLWTNDDRLARAGHGLARSISTLQI